MRNFICKKKENHKGGLSGRHTAEKQGVKWATLIAESRGRKLISLKKKKGKGLNYIDSKRTDLGGE